MAAVIEVPGFPPKSEINAVGVTRTRTTAGRFSPPAERKAFGGFGAPLDSYKNASLSY